jgi:hypothetical protein
MKIIYRVLDRRTSEILFESVNVDDCYKYVSDNYGTFSMLIRKKTIY